VLHLVVLCALAADVAGTDTMRLIMICTQVLAANYLTPALARFDLKTIAIVSLRLFPFICAQATAVS